MRHIRRFRFVWAAPFLLFAGCALMGKAPLDVLTYSGADKQTDAKRLIVFMRGLGGTHESFEKEGLVNDIRMRHMPYDMAAPNAHWGYYLGRTLIERLKNDVIDPAKAAGYEEIWLIGFSMGGLGSLMYLKEHPEDIQGVCLIGPFISYGPIQDEIASAGGLRQWNPGEYNPDNDWQRMLWHWVKEHVADNPNQMVYLSYGTGDPYVKGQQLIAEVLPSGRVNAIEGGHDYDTFKNLWLMLLESGIYETRAPETIARKN